tara:strand:+ start:1688 stop:2062 length:375 start_codon:yes stop_codon:yes gene_type:complete
LPDPESVKEANNKKYRIRNKESEGTQSESATSRLQGSIIENPTTSDKWPLNDTQMTRDQNPKVQPLAAACENRASSLQQSGDFIVYFGKKTTHYETKITVSDSPVFCVLLWLLCLLLLPLVHQR